MMNDEIDAVRLRAIEALHRLAMHGLRIQLDGDQLNALLMVVDESHPENRQAARDALRYVNIVILPDKIVSPIFPILSLSSFFNSRYGIINETASGLIGIISI
jgi:hypothetical protein